MDDTNNTPNPNGYSSIVVANELIRVAKENGKDMTHLKLHKLIYIMHGLTLATYRRPLISDRIEAWKYGPVIPELYHVAKRYGRTQIRECLETNDDTVLDSQSLKNIRYLLLESAYKDMTANDLVRITHARGSPWDQVYDADGFGGGFIDNDRIRQYYEKF